MQFALKWDPISSRTYCINSIIIKNTPLYKNTPLVCPRSVTRGGILIKSAEGREIFVGFCCIFFGNPLKKKGFCREKYVCITLNPKKIACGKTLKRDFHFPKNNVNGLAQLNIPIHKTKKVVRRNQFLCCSETFKNTVFSAPQANFLGGDQTDSIRIPPCLSKICNKGGGYS